MVYKKLLNLSYIIHGLQDVAGFGEICRITGLLNYRMCCYKVTKKCWQPLLCLIFFSMKKIQRALKCY